MSSAKSDGHISVGGSPHIRISAAFYRRKPVNQKRPSRDECTTPTRAVLPKTKPTSGKGRCLMDKVLPVSREFGSGGRELGSKAGRKAGHPILRQGVNLHGCGRYQYCRRGIPNYDEHIVDSRPLWTGSITTPFLTFTKYPCRTSISWPSPMSSTGWLLTVHVSLWGRCADMILMTA